MTRINTNVSSLNAQKNLARSNDQLQTALTRLSTGLRINSGKDDPAGLISSQILGAEIASTNTAISNTELANEMISTADSALSQISSLLEDIRSLVEEAANTGALSDSEIAANQLQIDASLEAINRIAQTTQFEGKNLLDGSLDYITDGVDSSTLSNLNITSANFGTADSVNVDVNVVAQAAQASLVYKGDTVSGDVVLDISGSEGTGTLSFGAGTTAAQIVAAVNQVSDATGVVASLTNRVSTDATAGTITLLNSNGTDGLTFTSVGTGSYGGDFTVKYVTTAGTSSTTASWSAGDPNVLQVNLETSDWTTAASVGSKTMSAATTAASAGAVTVATDTATGTMEIDADVAGEVYGGAHLVLINNDTGSGGTVGVTDIEYDEATKQINVTCGAGTSVTQIATAIDTTLGSLFTTSNVTNGDTSLVQVSDFGDKGAVTDSATDAGSLEIDADVSGAAYSGAHLTLVDNETGSAGVTDIYYDYENTQIMVTCGVGTTTTAIANAINNILGDLFTASSVTNGSTSAVAASDFGDKGAVVGTATDGGTVAATYKDIKDALASLSSYITVADASSSSDEDAIVDVVNYSGTIGDANVGESDDPDNLIQLTGTDDAANLSIEFAASGADQNFSIDYNLNTRTMGKSTALIQSEDGGVIQLQADSQGTEYDGITVQFVNDATKQSVEYDKENGVITVTNAASTTLTELAQQINDALGAEFTATVVSGGSSTMSDGAEGVTRDGAIYDSITINLATDSNGTVTTTAAEVVSAINNSTNLQAIGVTASNVNGSDGSGVMDSGTVTLSQVGVTAIDQAASGTTKTTNGGAGITVTAKTAGADYENVKVVVALDAESDADMYASYDATEKVLTLHASDATTSATALVNAINTGSGTDSSVKALFTFAVATGQDGDGNVTADDVGWLGDDTEGVTYTGTSEGGVESQGNYDAGEVVGTAGVTFSSVDYGTDEAVSIDVVSGTFTTYSTDTDGTATDTESSRATGTDATVRINGNTAVCDGLNVALTSASLSLEFRLASTLLAGDTFDFDITGGGATFQVGSEVKSSQQVNLGISSVSTTHLGGLNGLLYQLQSGGTASLTEDVTTAAAIVDEAITQVATVRGRLGAIQSTTLDTNISTLEDTSEALTTAQSNITDADFAEESANLTRAQILSQSGISVLSIANKLPQQVLSLLQQ